MNICLINSTPGWGGGERMFLELAEGFAEVGHRVVTVCRPRSALAARLPASLSKVLLPCRGDFDVYSLIALRRVLRTHGIEAVLANGGRDCMLGGLAALRTGIPVVRVKAMEETHHNLRNVLMYRHLLAGVVSVSQAVQDGLRDLHLPSAKLAVIHNGVTIRATVPSRQDARRELGIADSQFVVAYVGRFEREKGVDLLADLVEYLVETPMPVLLLVAGDGSLRFAVESDFLARGLGGSVRFLGFVDDPLRVLRAADAVVMPSRTEAFPVVALEALAMGVPLVACAAGGLLEIVSDGSDGLLTPIGDAPALAAALSRLYENPALGGQLVQNGRAKAAGFSRSRMIEGYVEFLATLQLPARRRTKD